MDKPNIEDVFMAFQKFNADQLAVMSNTPHGRWLECFKQNQDMLKARLEEFGLAQHIDWTDRNGN